jgi:hypothetical protein
MRGGIAYSGHLSPQSYNGAGVWTSGVAIQFSANDSA